MADRLVILGAGGNALDVLDTIEAINSCRPTWSIEGFLDDHRAPGSTYLGLPILGPIAANTMFRKYRFVSAIWNDKIFRHLEKLISGTEIPTSSFATIIHPGASVSKRAHIGHGVLIHHGASIAGNTSIANHVWIGPGAIVGHDSSIASYTVVAPGAILGGRVSVDASCYIGTAAMIRPDVQVEQGAMIGMGTVVIKNVPSQVTVVGNPAREIRPKT